VNPSQKKQLKNPSKTNQTPVQNQKVPTNPRKNDPKSITIIAWCQIAP
jgi:hypothetical protein